MGTGYLTIEAQAGDHALPISGAHVILKSEDGNPLYEATTDANGNTDNLPLPAPDKQFTLDPYYGKEAYSTYHVELHAKGYVTMHIHGVEILDTQVSILPVEMFPLVDEPNPTTEMEIMIPPIGLLIPRTTPQIGTSDTRVLKEVIIPTHITVHLGTPSNSSARNVRVPFPDYIKNVVCSEIYSTWPYNSLMANIHVIVTFALNRIYTEWYRGRGYNFDITNSTAFDQYYREGAMITENISQMVDEVFDIYARRIGFKDPFFTQFCNGTTATCNGLSQWGTVSLANQGKNPLEILHYYYPKDLELVRCPNIAGITASYPGYHLQLGSQGESVMRMQRYLNRIRVNFPLIPVISKPDGYFGADTLNAVKAFQKAFSLTQDGIIGRDTWNKISSIYVAVTHLAELDSEGERIDIGLNPPNVVLSQGSKGNHVLELQFILDAISPFYPSVPPVIMDGVFGPSVKNAVIEFQKTFQLTPDGIVGPSTWNKLYAVYRGITEITPPDPPDPIAPPYPGTLLKVGSRGDDVKRMQEYLNIIRILYPSIPHLTSDGIFGEGTKQAVIAFQKAFQLSPDGIIGSDTWNKIVEEYLLVASAASHLIPYPGASIKVGAQSNDVCTMQSFLNELHLRYPELPSVMIDGIFGPNMAAAVTAFQKRFGLTSDGIIGSQTWYTIIYKYNTMNQNLGKNGDTLI